jgi:hypothetical protein
MEPLKPNCRLDLASTCKSATSRANDYISKLDRFPKDVHEINTSIIQLLVANLLVILCYLSDLTRKTRRMLDHIHFDRR